MIIVGIDPGTETGYSEWEVPPGQLVAVSGMSAALAERRLRERKAAGTEMLVVLEDARLRGGGNWNHQRGRLQGVGSVKRDSARWVEFLQLEGIPFTTIKPRRRSTKNDAALFARITGWTARTNEHGRDAAMFVFGFSQALAESLIKQQQSAA